MLSAAQARASAQAQPGAGRLGDWLFVAALLFLAFLAGAFAILAKVFPYGYLHDAYRAGAALVDQMTKYDSPVQTNLWAPARRPEAGVTVFDRLRAQPGYTLYTSGHAQKAFLVSMTGRALHEWRLPYSRIWDENAAVRNPRPDDFIFWFDVRLMANGDLLASYDGVGDTPWGYGLVKMDKDSRVIWKYLARVHHTFDIAPDGRVFALTHEVRSEAVEGYLAFDEPPRIDDFIVVLSPEGRELQKVSIVDAFLRSPYARLLHTAVPNALGDPLHTNAVKFIDHSKAYVLPFAQEGQVMISLREIATIAVLDLETQTIVWALRGPWMGQHDPDILPNGNILLFDNYGHYGAGGVSRVVEFDPNNLETVWTYTGDADNPLESSLRAEQQRLPNGNTLITESEGGRILEVAPDGDVVWEFINPVRGGESRELIPVVSAAERIDPRALDHRFLGVLRTAQ